MINTLTSLVGELREVGIPVSIAEAIDAAAALEHIDIAERDGVREALAATLVKTPGHRRAFDIAFDVFFGIGGSSGPDNGFDASEGVVEGDEIEALMSELAGALGGGDRDDLRGAVRSAVSRLSGFQAGRPVGGRYYLYRVMQRLDGIEEMLFAAKESGPLAERLSRDDVVALMQRLRSEVRREIVRRLVADRGAAPVARTIREPLVEDVELMHATRDELERIEAAIAPLARKLATRLAQRRRMSSKGRLDLRRTIRRSLGNGGVLTEPRFRKPTRSKPEIVLLCDVSGSMATFARFTLQFTHAIAHQFSAVRSFAFVDEVDEVSSLFDTGSDFADSLVQMSERARVVGHDGHSDYGNVLRSFVACYEEAVSPRSTLIITGDARSNYRDSEARLFAGIAQKARSVFWLNPEAKRFWNTGDSVMSDYEGACHQVREVRSLRQLESFVAEIALPAKEF